MIQYFFNENSKLLCSDINSVWLSSVSHTDKTSKANPRMLHKHDDCLELVFIESGHGNFFLDRQYYPVKKGDFIIYNQGVLHDELSAEGDTISSYSLSFKDFNYNNLPINHLIQPDHIPIISTGAHEDSFQSLFSTLFKLTQLSDHPNEEACQHIGFSILKLLLFLTEERPLTQESEVKIEQDLDLSETLITIKKYLDENYQNDISLQKISDTFHLDTYYIVHLFKNKTGYSPMQYINRRRIGEAQSLLISTNMKVSEIASYVGYLSSHAMSAHFKKYIGMSPRTYRDYFCNLEK